MREFKTLCTDNVTGMVMVLSECSYNMACDWLVHQGFTFYDNFNTYCGMVVLTFSKPVRRTFMYDEARGYLLSN